MEIEKITSYYRKKISPSQLRKLKNMGEMELLEYTWIPLDRIDHIERGEDYVYIADRGLDVGGCYTIDNSTIFTTRDFITTEKDRIFSHS